MHKYYIDYVEKMKKLTLDLKLDYASPISETSGHTTAKLKPQQLDPESDYVSPISTELKLPLDSYVLSIPKTDPEYYVTFECTTSTELFLFHSVVTPIQESSKLSLDPQSYYVSPIIPETSKHTSTTELKFLCAIEELSDSASEIVHSYVNPNVHSYIIPI